MVEERGLSNITCVPTSFQSQQLIVEAGLCLSDLIQTPVLDVAFDGADEIDPELNAIKGGGGAHTLEKLVATAAGYLVLLVDDSKESDVLGTTWAVPVEVIPAAYVVVTTALKALGAESAALRMAKAKAGPVVTDNGNFILDAAFGPIPGPEVAAKEAAINCIPGVVENGIFAGVGKEVYIGTQEGTVSHRCAPGWTTPSSSSS